MVVKIVFLIAFLASQAFCVTEVRLNDLNVHYIQHPLIGTSFNIPLERFEDNLTNCDITFPDGIMYTVYPTANHPNLDLMSMPQGPQSLIKSCSVILRNVGKEYSGVYELMSTVQKYPDDEIVVTRRKFILEVVESDFS